MIVRRYIGFLAIVFFLNSCSRSQINNHGHELVIGTYQKPTEINPLTTDSSISANLINLVFDPLFTCSLDEQLLPNIIESWSVSEDGKVWSFALKKNILFHDQKALKSSDVKFTYEFLRNKSGGHANYLKSLEEVKVIDDYRFDFILRAEDNYIKTALCEFGIAPQHLLDEKIKISEFNKHPVGSGPYQFVSQSDQEIVLKKNGNYRFQSEIDRLIIRIFTSQKAVLNHLLAETIDMAFLVNPEDYGALEKTSYISIYDNWYPLLYMLLFNENEKLFTVLHRQVIGLLINRDDLLDTVLKEKGFLTKGTLSPDSREYHLLDFKNEYNPQKALYILHNEGWADHDGDGLLDLHGKKFEFTTYGIEGEGVAELALRMVQKQLAEAGIRMNIEMLPFDAYIEKVFRKQNFQSNIVYLVFRSSYNNDFSFWHSSQIKEGLNFSHYQNKKVDLYLENMRSELDPEKRKNINLEMQKELIASPPGVFLFWRKMPIAIHKRFYNVPEKRMQNLRDIIYFKVKDDESYHHKR